MENKHRFVFSIVEEEKRSAAVRFNLTVAPKNVLPDSDYQLTIIEAAEETGSALKDRFAQVKDEKQSNHKKYCFSEDFDHIFFSMMSNFTIFQQKIFDGQEAFEFNHDFQIGDEGVYNTFFFFAPRRTKQASAPEDEDFLDTITGWLDGGRTLRQSQLIDWSNTTHLAI